MEFNIKRICSTLIDHLIFGSIAAFITFPGLLYDFILSPFDVTFGIGNVYLNAFALFVYVSKDVLTTNSPGKKLMKLKLLSNSSSSSINGYQLLARNITFLFWPVEIMVEFLNPQRRLGDYIGRTKVIEASDADDSGNRISLTSKIGALLVAAILCFLIQLQIAKLLTYINENLD